MSVEPGVGDVVARRYRLEARIGEGGQGGVFRATDTKLQREVALKLLRADGARDLATLQRFELEAELAKNLRHPNTLRLVDFGRGDDGAPFIAYELLEGEGLDALLRREQALSQPRVARIALQILKALMEAHGAGVVHRDIKPANIFLCRFAGEDEFVKILDFGIAKRGGGVTSPAITAEGFAIGTPHYMAPEQVRGQAVPPSADLYALGLLMAEALAGHVIVDGPSAMDVSAAQIAAEPVPLPAGVLQSSLGPVIHRATRKNPAQRFATAEEMLAALENAAAVLEDATRAPSGQLTAGQRLGFLPTGEIGALTGGVPAAPPTAAMAKGKGRKGRGLAIGLGVLLGVSLVGGGVFTATMWADTTDAKKKPKKKNTPATKSKKEDPKPVGPPPPEGMVTVPAGEFLMGCKPEDLTCPENAQPQRSVYLDAFFIDKTEVTVARYADCVKAGRCEDTADVTAKGCNANRTDRGAHPINCVQWAEAVAFCAYAGKRLPTEAEWEKAARGTDGRPYPWGSAPPTCELAVISQGGAGCGRGETAEVGRVPAGASPYGALDMAGNLKEWVQDGYQPTYYRDSPIRNPPPPAKGVIVRRDEHMVARGGGFSIINDSYRSFSRGTHERVTVSSRTFLSNNGMRCAKSAP